MTNDIALVVLVQAMLLAAVVILREPKLLIPCVVLGLPVEWAETQLFSSLGDSGLRGALRSLLNPGQLAMVATVVVAVVRSRHEPWRLLPNSLVALPVLLLTGLLVLGVLWSDTPTRPANIVLIMPLYVGFLFAAPSLIEDRRDVERIIVAFLAAAVLLSVLATAQRLVGVFQWREALIGSDAVSYRSNATFSDPNILARFLAIAMALAAGLVLARGPSRVTVYLALPALAFGALAIVATASRSGWIMLLFCGFVVVLTSPIARYTKAKLTLAAFGGLGVGLTLLLLQGGADAERVKSITNAASTIGQRSFLIRAGWEMWKDNPLYGVGSGNYQHSLLTNYRHFVPSWTFTSLSHTTIITILAELGILGLLALMLASLRTAITVVRTYYATTSAYHRLVIGWLGAALLSIFLHSQSEGRLLEEPYLWVLLALLVAYETSPQLAGRAGVARGLFQPARRERSAAPAPASGGAMPVPAAPITQSD